ncbi:hypothetical protein E2C01_084330 [Portunus trituberculatus]|uniref:Uncharacterized protein n=1 Tax=Portunus trituberculatus TaxID=210409 RepID=A0A5B7J610_PORTR|nr:hypothetical protein [Portunus trituberculatus]
MPYLSDFPTDRCPLVSLLPTVIQRTCHSELDWEYFFCFPHSPRSIPPAISNTTTRASVDN